MTEVDLVAVVAALANNGNSAVGAGTSSFIRDRLMWCTFMLDNLLRQWYTPIVDWLGSEPGTARRVGSKCRKNKRLAKL